MSPVDQFFGAAADPVAEARASRQPRLPQPQGGPSIYILMWPASPAMPFIPSQILPSKMIPRAYAGAERQHADGITPTFFPCLTTHSASAATLASFSTSTRRLRLAALPRAVRGHRSPGDWADFLGGLRVVREGLGNLCRCLLVWICGVAIAEFADGSAHVGDYGVAAGLQARGDLDGFQDPAAGV